MLGMSDDEAQIAYEALKNRLAAGKERGRNNGKKILLAKTTNGLFHKQGNEEIAKNCRGRHLHNYIFEIAAFKP